MIKKEHPPNAKDRTFFEGGPSGGAGSGGGGGGSGSGSSSDYGTDKGKRKEDPHSEKSKSVEDTSTKGEKQEAKKYKEKGKQVMSDEDFYYQGEQDDFQAFKTQKEPPTENEYEQEALFDEWEEG